MQDNKRWFYLALFWVVNFCLGSFYAWSVYSTWLAQHYSVIAGTAVSVASLTFVFSIGAAMNPIAMVAAGFLTDRLGPRPVLFGGGLIVTLGYYLMSISTDSSLLLIGYGICFGLGSGACVIATVTSAVKLFPTMRGFAGGSVGAMYGLGSVCLPPTANALAQSFGITSTLLFFAAACFVVIMTSAFLIKIPASRSVAPKAGSEDLNWLQMIKTTRFWAMFVLFLGATLSPLMLFSQTVTVAQVQIGLGMSAAVLSVSVLALANMSARFLAGTLSDKLGRALTLALAIFMAVLGLLLLSMAGRGDAVFFYLGLVCIGVCFGSSVGIFPGYVAEQFGPANASMNYGVMALAFSVSGIIGPNIIRMSVEGGQYQNAYFIAMAISAVGLLAAWYCKSFEKKH